MGRNAVETILGAVVLLVAFFFLSFAYETADLKVVKGYDVTARFYKVGGLEVGSDVRVGGIKVGTVTGQHLDMESYAAVLKLSLKSEVRLPVDTVASINSDGLMGGKYIKLTPGREKEMLESGSLIKKTQDYESLEDMVGEIIFLATGSKDS